MKWLSLIPFVCTTASALVHIFGDSILASNTPIQKDLEKFAPNATFQNFAKIGAGMRDGWVESIPSIYNQNKDPLPTTIFVDGGGNDVNSVRQDCLGMTTKCTATIDEVVDGIDNLIQDMRNDGVRNIVYVGFFYIPGFEAAVDYGNTKVASVCQASQGCYFVDLRPVPVTVGWDGMHPVESSYHDISAKIQNTILTYNITL